ncbi:hypothetical protein P9477_08825 [Enterobacter mori]|uniref:hypothetical protein n=1 Tax=Enterobacter mori TaxID=539813 RepID=UPI00398BA7D4
MNELLKSSIEALSIMHINIRESEVKLSDGYNAFNFNSVTKKTQSFRNIKKIEAIELVNEEDSSTNQLYYSFHYSLGLRFVTPTQAEEHERVLTIEALYEAIYRSKRELSKEELEEFAKQNVGFNVWPFWREFVQNSTSRMGINSVSVPFFKYNRSDIPNLEK